VVQSALNALSSVPAATGAVNAQQTVTLTGGPTGGTFTLTFGGQTTSNIAYNAAASTVQTDLQALSSIGSGNATVSGSAGGPYTVTFIGTLGDAPRALMTASGSGLTGGSSPGVSIASLTTGVAPTYNITVSGSAGGPYTVTFGNLLGDVMVAPLLGETALHGDGTGLTGGTDPTVTVTVQTQGQPAFVNQALANTTQQYDGVKNFYDHGSGNYPNPAWA
jgi:hypothetical protein